MPIDTGIYDSLIRPPQPVESPLNAMAKASVVQESRQQSQDKMQAAQRDAQIRQIVAQSGGDIEKALPQIATIDPDRASKYQEAVERTSKFHQETIQSKIGLEGKLATGVSDILSNVQSAPPEERQHAYQTGLAQINAMRQMMGMPASEMAPQYDEKTVNEYLTKSNAVRDFAGSNDAMKGEWMQIGDDPTRRFVQVNQKTGKAMWRGKDVTDQVRDSLSPKDQAEVDKDANKVQSPEIEAIKAFTAAKGRKPTEAELDQIHRRYKEAGTVVRVTAGGAGGSTGGLTAGEGGGLELAGTMTRLLGRVPVGMARAGSAPAIMNEAARQTKMLGQTPVVMMQRAAMYQGDTKALANLQKMQSASDAYESKASAQLDIVDRLSDSVWRTKSPLINRAIIAGETEIAGDKDATLLLNAIQTASTEYAKIMMGGTASAAAVTDSAQKEAQKLLSAGMSKGTLKGATALMRQEMGLTMKGYDAAISHITENMGGVPQQPAPQTSASAGGGPKVGERRNFNGKIGEWDGKGWKAVQP